MLEKCEKTCADCEYATALFDKSSMLCSIKGVVSKTYTCKKFSYDPLKRVPPRVQNAPELEYVDIDEVTL